MLPFSRVFSRFRDFKIFLTFSDLGVISAFSAFKKKDGGEQNSPPTVLSVHINNRKSAH
jgi:hypothetical protein